MKPTTARFTNEVTECSPNAHSFNDHGFCRTCGATINTEEPKTVEPFHLNGNWPTNTWFQRRKRELARKEAE